MVLVLLTACGRESERERRAAALTGASPRAGKVAIERFGCAACHIIPGIPGAESLVGPSLTAVASRAQIAGVLPNSPDNMVRWLQDPPGIKHRTSMPSLYLTERDARAIASYLYTLE